MRRVWSTRSKMRLTSGSARGPSGKPANSMRRTPMSGSGSRAARDLSDRRSRFLALLSPEGRVVQDADKRQMSIAFAVVQAVPDDEPVRNLEPAVRDRKRFEDSPAGAVQQGAELQARWGARLQQAQQVSGGEAGVDDVLDQEHVPSRDL